MKITWTVTIERTLFVTDDEMKDMVNDARDFMCVFGRKDAIKAAVQHYLDGQDDTIFYTITEEATEQIEAEVNKLLIK